EAKGNAGGNRMSRGGCFRWIVFVFVAFAALMVGLFFLLRPSGVARRPAVPSDLQALAVVPGFPNFIRYFPTDATHEAQFEKHFLEPNERERPSPARHGQTGALPPPSYLAISGGGDNGAFGAGLLNGWSATGDRPMFKLVTGTSTGALIAPFAFLGPAYDST